jgi:hypothetical protein
MCTGRLRRRWRERDGRMSIGKGLPCASQVWLNGPDKLFSNKLFSLAFRDPDMLLVSFRFWWVPIPTRGRMQWTGLCEKNTVNG